MVERDAVSFDAWITGGATHDCGCGVRYTDADGGCSTVWPCADCEADIDCEGEHPDERVTRCEACREKAPVTCDGCDGDAFFVTYRGGVWLCARCLADA